jgi:hypothetical protein
MPPLEQRHLDRIRGLYMGRPDSERFTALMLAQIAGPEVTEQTLNAVRGQAPDLNRRISSRRAIVRFGTFSIRRKSKSAMN